MPQQKDNILPIFVQTDKDYSRLESVESPFIKGMDYDINANPNGDIGTSNPTGEGQNQYVLKPMRSNQKVPNIGLLPSTGVNRNILSFESVVTNELYYYNYNSEGQHGVYVLNGETGVWSKVIVDPELAFSDDPKYAIADHRCRLRIVKDKDGNILEKYLILTDGKNWHKFINVIAAIETDGFNANTFPYWTLRPPHFDRRELFEYAVRPPMIAPIAELLPNTDEEAGKINRLVDASFQFAISFQNTDGRESTLSPYSLPINIVSEEYLTDPEQLPKRAKLTLYAGSPLTEKINLYVKKCGGDWYLYDTIKRFESSGDNAESVIGSRYWLRTNQWASYNYNTEFNTIEYEFDNSRVATIVSKEDFTRLQSDMPQLSVGMTDFEDKIGLVNNRYGYNNFGNDVTDKFDVEVVEKEEEECNKPLRDVYVYAYLGLGNADGAQFISQIGYTLTDDPQVRFGGMRAMFNEMDFDVDASKRYNLDFANKSALQCYLKGTPYSAIGKWYEVKTDNSMVEINRTINADSEGDKEFLHELFVERRSYVVCRFHFRVPAGRYIAALGRHNVATSGDYRNTSTYVVGIANSRVRSIELLVPFKAISVIKYTNAIVSNSKEIEIDCTGGDVDVWGNNADLFYVFCPHDTAYSFIEGYLKETPENPVPVEMFPYVFSGLSVKSSGVFTDKNGFYWAAILPLQGRKINFRVKLNCSYPFEFEIPPSQEGKYSVNEDAFVSDYNGGTFGECNRVLYSGTIRSLDGSTTYANVGISIKDGPTVYSRSDGTFTLIIHNGMPNNRISNVYVNAGGNFLISLEGCGDLPVYNYIEPPCVNCTTRQFFPNLDLNIRVSTNSQRSLKEAASYTVGIVGGDLAGRLTYVNPVKNVRVSSFQERNNLSATYFRVLLDNLLNINTSHPDTKWFAFYVSKNTTIKRFVQWVGDEINFIDSNGNVVNDPASAVFCSIRINSLYNYNVSNNFSVLASYQFVKGDRLRIMDDGENLLDTATYGDPIDVQILGTNYNQAAIEAGLLEPSNNTVLNPTSAQSEENTSITLIIRYDARLNPLIDKTGIWIEIYTPSQESENVPFCEVGSFFPVINGKVAVYEGMDNGQPVYSYPSSVDLDYWDTYFLRRSIAIPDVGSPFFNHPFESPNITDDFGAGCTSCGRLHVQNEDALQQWFGGDVIRSDAFNAEGILNGLATFRNKNRKDYGTYPNGSIISAHSKRNLIAFICENDWFIISYKQPYSTTDAQGRLVTNTGELSEPYQKSGDVFGCAIEHIGTVIVDDSDFYWYDSRNTAMVRCNYQTATDISKEDQQRGERGGLESYLNSKITFVENWNGSCELKDRFDVLTGIDTEKGKLYLTFRPRRNNTTDISSYINHRRNIDLRHQETAMYDTTIHGWTGFAPFTPQGYGRVRGKWANVEFISFANGEPYRHNNSPSSPLLTYYDQPTQPVVIAVLSGGKEMSMLQKIFQTVSFESNPNRWMVDMAYTDFLKSYSWLSENNFLKIGNQWHGALLQNANTYPPANAEELFKSMLLDGMNLEGKYMVLRLVGPFGNIGEYTELKSIGGMFAVSPANRL